MVEISFWMGELIFAFLWILARVIVWLKRGRIDWKREGMLLLMFVNLAVIIRFTFYPMELADGKIQPLPFDIARIIPIKTQLIPFAHLFEFETTAKMQLNIIGNIAMFIPSGIILPILYKKLDSFWKTVGAGALISLSIELIQLLFYTRTTDINDLILNTLGAALGYGIYAIVKAITKKHES